MNPIHATHLLVAESVISVETRRLPELAERFGLLWSNRACRLYRLAER